MINSISINNTNSLSFEKKKDIINNKFIKDNYNKSNIKYNINGNNSIKFNTIDTNIINNNENKISELHRKPLFLDLYHNNKINDKNNSNHKAIITDTNLNLKIKVNIKINKDKEKEYTPINTIIKKKRFLKNNIDKETKNINEDCSQMNNKLNKIIFIHKYLKKYKQKKILKNLFYHIKIIIYKNIMKKLYINHIKYYLLKWYNIIYLKKIIEKLIIKKQKYIINKAKNIYRKADIIQFKNKNLTDRKIKRMKKLNDFHEFINKNIFDNNIDNLLNNNINNYSQLEEKTPISSNFQSNIKKVLYRCKKSLEKKKNYNNNIYSTLNNNKKNKIIFNTIDINNLNLEISNLNQRYKEIKKINHNYHPINNLKKYNYKNEKNISNTFNFKNSQKDNNKKLNNNNNKILKNKSLNVKYNLNFNNKENDNQTFLSYNQLLKTEPNKSNTHFINNKTSNTINMSKKNNKNKNRYFKIKKFDTCPLTFKDKKLNLYKRYYIIRYFNIWNKKVLSNKIIYSFIKSSKQMKLRKIIYKKLIISILNIFNTLLLKKYFDKYKDIIIRKIIIQKLKKYIFYNYKNNNNIFKRKKRFLKQGDIINNININNFINYTNNDITDFIPKTTKNYNIIANSLKINHSEFPYFNNFDNDEDNIINTNYNFDINKNYNTNNNKYISIKLDKKIKKKNNGNLVDQINQFRMVFNLLDQHYNNNIYSLFNCFNKWKYLSINKRYYKSITYNNNNIEKYKVNEKFINFKKINSLKENINIKDINLGNNNIKAFEIKNIDFYNMKNKKEKNENFIKINNKKLYSARQSNSIRDFKKYNIEAINKNNKKIRYIDINKNIVDNSSESSFRKNNYNSEIVYQKKILNYNHTLNKNNISNYPINDFISENVYSFKKINKIEEREVHFNSLSTNKNNSYSKLGGKINIFNNKKNFNNIYGNNKYLEKQIKSQIEKIKIGHNTNLYTKRKDFNNDSSSLFNKLKSLFVKKNKIKNIQVNQTFCGFPHNLLDETY